MIIQKLDILQESGIIDAEVYSYVRSAMDHLQEAGIDVEKRAETFLVHLAMAAARQKTDEPPIARMDAVVIDQIEQSPQYPHAQAIWEKLEALSPVPFGAEELDYCYLHLCTMLQ